MSYSQWNVVQGAFPYNGVNPPLVPVRNISHGQSAFYSAVGGSAVNNTSNTLIATPNNPVDNTVIGGGVFTGGRSNANGVGGGGVGFITQISSPRAPFAAEYYVGQYGGLQTMVGTNMGR